MSYTSDQRARYVAGAIAERNLFTYHADDVYRAGWIDGYHAAPRRGSTDRARADRYDAGYDEGVCVAAHPDR